MEIIKFILYITRLAFGMPIFLLGCVILPKEVLAGTTENLYEKLKDKGGK